MRKAGSRSCESDLAPLRWMEMEPSSAGYAEEVQVKGSVFSYGLGCGALLSIFGHLGLHRCVFHPWGLTASGSPGNLDTLQATACGIMTLRSVTSWILSYVFRPVFQRSESFKNSNHLAFSLQRRLQSFHFDLNKQRPGSQASSRCQSLCNLAHVIGECWGGKLPSSRVTAWAPK